MQDTIIEIKGVNVYQEQKPDTAGCKSYRKERRVRVPGRENGHW